MHKGKNKFRKNGLPLQEERSLDRGGLLTKKNNAFSLLKS